MSVPDHLADYLARTLAQLLGGHNAGQIALTPLSKPQLIGLLDDGMAAIYYDHFVHYHETAHPH